MEVERIEIERTGDDGYSLAAFITHPESSDAPDSDVPLFEKRVDEVEIAGALLEIESGAVIQLDRVGAYTDGVELSFNQSQESLKPNAEMELTAVITKPTSNTSTPTSEEPRA